MWIPVFKSTWLHRDAINGMQRRWPYTTSKPISSTYLQEYLTTVPQAYGTDYYHKPKSQSASFDNLMPPQICRHTRILVAHSTTTKCHSPQWGATHRYRRKPTSEALGNFIWWMDGISSHDQKQAHVRHCAIPTQMHH